MAVWMAALKAVLWVVGMAATLVVMSAGQRAGLKAGMTVDKMADLKAKLLAGMMVLMTAAGMDNEMAEMWAALKDLLLVAKMDLL